MSADNLDALVIYGDSSGGGGGFANSYYLTGYRDPLFCYVVVTSECEPLLLVSNPLYLPHAREMSVVQSVESLGWEPGVSVAQTLKRSGPNLNTIATAGVRGIHSSSLPYSHMRTLTDSFAGADWRDATDLMQRVRNVKSPEEIRLLRRGAQITDATVTALARSARAGMHEYELASIVHGTSLSMGGDQRLLFLGSTLMAEPRLVFPRQHASGRTLRRGDIVLDELSTSYGGYPGQIHRPLVIGRPTPEYARLFDVAREIYEHALATLGPGATDRDLRRTVAPILSHVGVSTMDVLLHGWGLSLEPPRLDVEAYATIQRPQEATTFVPGMVAVLQPHVVSSDGRRGIQLGSSLVITEDGAEALQRLPLDWIQLDAN